MADWMNGAAERSKDFTTERHFNTGFLQAEQESRELHRTAHINPDPDGLLENQQSFQLIRATPPSPQHWRLPRTRTGLNHNLDRIYTDYLLRSDFVDDINYMLDHIHNWSADDAYEIMQSFERDSSNAGRRVRFIPVSGESRQWLLRIENPAFPALDVEEIQRSSGDGFNVHRQRLMRDVESSGGASRQPQKAFDPPIKSNSSPLQRASSAIPSETMRSKGSELEALQGEKARAQMTAETMQPNTHSKISASLPLNMLCKPIDSSHSAAAHTGTLLSSLANEPKVAGSPTLAPPNVPANERFKPAKRDPTEPPEPLECLQPPPTPRLSARDANFSDEQRDQLLAVKSTTMGPPPRPREESQFQTVPRKRRNSAVARVARRNERVRSRYMSTASCTTSKQQFFCKVLPLEATQAKHLMEERAATAVGLHSGLSMEDVEEHNIEVSQTPTKFSIEAAEKSTKEVHQQLEPWQVNPDRH
ncbi:hypothetical protein IQ06DRAFT_368410 [Phaeosphaeriaceae sp. SRC1lsM3a]|nr:hypothetical protein IQ06DRAFT_368410 [Stagonospora sp. SRC1lsM3a]